MPASGYTPLSLYYSSTAAAQPSAGNLVNGELALNITDGKLYYKDNSGTVQLLASKAGSSGSFTNLTVSGDLTLSGGTANGVAYLNGSKVLTTGSALTFDGTNLGVANSSPLDALTVGTTSTGKNIRINSSSNGNNGLLRMFDLGGTERLQLGVNSTGEAVYYSPTGSVHAWYINAEQMRLTSTGLGIGTSSPNGKLTIGYSSALIDGLIFNNTATNGRQWRIGDGSGTFAGNFGFYDATAAATRMVLDSSGNLGLGVTPSNAFANSRSFEFGANAILWSQQASGIYNSITTGLNFYYDAAGVAKYKSTGVTASSYSQYLGQHQWHTAPSGTAGAAISFTQAMTLDASGNLGIGTSSPRANLDVAAASAYAVYAGGTGTYSLRLGHDNTGAYVTSINSGTSYTDITTLASNVIFNTGTSSTTERMRIDSSGNVGIGTTSTTNYILRVNATSPLFGMMVSGTQAFTIGALSGGGGAFYYGAGNAEAMRIDSSGNLQVSNLAGTGNRAVYSTSTGILTNSSSDGSLKENDTPISQGLDAVLAMRPISYEWIDKEKMGAQREIGFIAQEMQQIVPEVVGSNSDETLSIDYPKLVAVMAKAIQELTARVVELEAK